MASQCWSPQSQDPSLHSTAVSSASQSDSFVSSPQLVHTDNTKLVAVYLKTSSGSRLPSSNLHQLLASSTSTIVSSSGISSRLSAGDSASAGTQASVYSQSLAKIQSQQKPSSQRCLAGGIKRSLFSTDSELFAQNSASSVKSQPTAPISEESLCSAQRDASSPKPWQVYQPADRTAIHLRQSPSSQKDCSVTRLDEFSSTDIPSSPPIHSNCVSPPDHFLSPSPSMGYSADSPYSLCDTTSPDTTECIVTMDADSGYSDNVVDKSTSPEKPLQTKEDDLQTTPSKRKRVRKSRAKPQDPQQKVIVKRTRRVRANDRERSRMHGLNDAMDELRKHIPNDGSAGKMTKIDTLRTAANYIRVLKMMLGDIDKGEDMSHWPSDMIAAVNNLYVQPAASPDSTGVISPGPTNTIACDDGQLQTCGVVSAGVMVSGQFPPYQNQNCSLVDGYHTTGTNNGALHNVNHQISNFLGHSAGSNASVVCSNSYNSPVPVSNTSVNSGYNMNSFVSPAMNNVYSQQYSVSNHPASAQNIFQQSSPCY